MENLFQTFDSQENTHADFWQNCGTDWYSDISSNKILEGNFKIGKVSNSPSKLGVVTKKFIYQFEPQGETYKPEPSSRVCISWKRIEPFTEKVDNQDIFGFRLTRGSDYQDFFFDSQYDIENWLTKLSKYVISIDLYEDYTVIKQIGKGSNARVYLARSDIDQELYAIKTIKLSKLSEQRAQQQFKEELEVMRYLDHPQILKLYAVYQDQLNLHLVLEYSPCGDLLHKIYQERIFDEDQIKGFAYNALQTLNYMHCQGFMHRDLKLENILLMSQDDVSDIRIADFGLAAKLNQMEMKKCGSPGYVAPEILRDLPYDQKIDIFSLGVILYILQVLYRATGQSPFYGNSPAHILDKNTRCLIDFSTRLWGNVSKECKNFISRLLAADPKYRPSAKRALLDPWLNRLDKRHCPSIIKLSRESSRNISPMSPISPDVFQGHSDNSQQMIQRILSSERKQAQLNRRPEQALTPTRPAALLRVNIRQRNVKKQFLEVPQKVDYTPQLPKKYQNSNLSPQARTRPGKKSNFSSSAGCKCSEGYEQEAKALNKYQN